MVNEDIVTALRNAVNRGESLESAISIMINSGYDAREVQEASQFVPGVIPIMQTTAQQLHSQTFQQIPQPSQTQLPTQSIQQLPYQLPIQQTLQQPLQTQQPKKSYFKEIVLVIILLVLLGILASTIFFRDQILGFFS